MKKILLLSTLLVAVLFVGCKSDDDLQVEDTTNIDINFTGSYGSDALQMLKEYTYGDGKAIKFAQFDFYVSNIVLIKNDSPETTVTDLKEIDFIDLSKSSEEAAKAGQTISIQNIPVGVYSGVRLGLGVSPDLNRTKPEDYGSNSPLKKASHYWTGWSSYIFSKIECFADLNEDGEIITGGADTESMSYHTGTDEVYKEVTILKDLTLTKDVTGTIKLNLDISQAFNMTNPEYDANADGYLDIETFTGTHSDTQLQIAKKILDNLGESITIEL